LGFLSCSGHRRVLSASSPAGLLNVSGLLGTNISFFEKPEFSVLLQLIVMWSLECRSACWLVLVEGQDLIAISGKCFCL